MYSVFSLRHYSIILHGIHSTSSLSEMKYIIFLEHLVQLSYFIKKCLHVLVTDSEHLIR